MEATLAAIERGDAMIKYEGALNEQDADVLMLALQECKTLNQLDLSCGTIAPATVARLASALEKLTTLVVLFLDGNGITDAGATALASALPKCTSLEILFLANNKITDVGVSALAKAFEMPTTAVMWLNLTSNQITDVGAAAMASALKKSTTMTRLTIALNEITDVGAAALASAVDTATMEVLHVFGPRVTEAGQRAVDRALRRSKARRALLGVVDLLQKDGDHALAWRVARFLV